jgi:hypothetical protein
LKLVENKVVLPSGTKERLKMLPEFKYTKECSHFSAFELSEECRLGDLAQARIARSLGSTEVA